MLFGCQKTVVVADRLERRGTASQTVYLASLVLDRDCYCTFYRASGMSRMVASGDANDPVLTYIVRIMLIAVRSPRRDTRILFAR
jgi:hypothetical protein